MRVSILPIRARSEAEDVEDNAHRCCCFCRKYFSRFPGVLEADAVRRRRPNKTLEWLFGVATATAHHFHRRQVKGLVIEEIREWMHLEECSMITEGTWPGTIKQ